MKYKLGHGYFLEVEGEKYFISDWDGRTEIKIKTTFDNLLEHLKKSVKFACNQSLGNDCLRHKLPGRSPFLR